MSKSVVVNMFSQNVSILCRICLTTSTNLTHLTQQVEQKHTHDKLTVAQMIEMVTKSRVVINEQLPSKICCMCLSFLKISFGFLMDFKNSAIKLEKIQNVVQEIEKPPDVELIVGNHKFGLDEVLIVETLEEPNNFKGFLKNLGHEVSAYYVQPNKKNCVSPFIPEIKSKTPQNLSFSNLQVKKYANECKVVIEHVDNTIKTIIKTLYECPLCKKIVNNRENLELHKSLSHPSKITLVCEKCGHLATTQSQFYHHMQKHKGKRFKCNHHQCNKSYDTISHLKVHLESHKNLKSFLCNVCGKRFNYSVSLKYHLRLHADKKLICNVCGLKFRMANTLKRHLRTHTKEKPYFCDFCGKNFSSSGEKKQHEKLHTGEKPHQCEFCGRGFAKLDNLKVHFLSHEGPHNCIFCEKSFLSLHFLEKHIGMKHKGCV